MPKKIYGFKEYPFTAHIRKSVNKQWYCVLCGYNNEDVFVGETRKTKAGVKRLIDNWFPRVEVVDETLKAKKK